MAHLRLFTRAASYANTVAVWLLQQAHDNDPVRMNRLENASAADFTVCAAAINGLAATPVFHDAGDGKAWPNCIDCCVKHGGCNEYLSL